MKRIAKEYWLILSSAHANVRWFFLASFFLQLGNGFNGILYNLYIKNLGLPDTVAGAVVSASSLAGALALIPAGILSDRFGRKRAIIASGIGTVAVSLFQAFMVTPVTIVGLSFISGAIGSVVWVTALPLLAENTSKDERFHLFSVNFGIGLMAQVLGSVLSGSISQLLAQFGMSQVLAVRYTLVLGVLLSLIALPMFLKIREAKRTSAGDEPVSKPNLRLSLVALRTDKSQFGLIGRFTACAAFIGFGAGLVIPYLNLYFAERFHMSRSHIGIVIGCAQAVTALAMFIGPAMAQRLGPVKAVLVLQMGSIPFLLLTGWAQTAWLASAAVMIRNALMNAGNPIQDSVMMALVGEKYRGFAVSCGQTMFTLGWAVMGPVSTNIVSRFGSYTGYAIVFSATATLYLIGSLFYGKSFFRHEQRVYDTSNAIAS